MKKLEQHKTYLFFVKDPKRFVQTLGENWQLIDDSFIGFFEHDGSLKFYLRISKNGGNHDRFQVIYSEEELKTLFDIYDMKTFINNNNIIKDLLTSNIVTSLDVYKISDRISIEDLNDQEDFESNDLRKALIRATMALELCEEFVNNLRNVNDPKEIKSTKNIEKKPVYAMTSEGSVLDMTSQTTDSIDTSSIFIDQNINPDNYPQYFYKSNTIVHPGNIPIHSNELVPGSDFGEWIKEELKSTDTENTDTTKYTIEKIQEILNKNKDTIKKMQSKRESDTPW